MTSEFLCPTDNPPERRPDETVIIGCGAAFTGEFDDDGIVDCPHCGIWFTPAIERTGARASGDAMGKPSLNAQASGNRAR